MTGQPCAVGERPTGHRVVHHAEDTEVDLALHPRLAVRDAERRGFTPEAALLRREPVQRPIRHDQPAVGELAVNVRQLQICPPSRSYPDIAGQGGVEAAE